MAWTTLIGVDEFAENIDHCTVIDARYDLMNHEAGRTMYAAGHIPGAFFLDQATDLAGPKFPGSGRHPLPERETLAARLRACGLSSGRPLVVYDAANGMFASRLWWLARWLGHAEVAVLDGGLEAWQRARFPVTPEVPAWREGARAGNFQVGSSRVPTIDATTLRGGLDHGAHDIVDARAPERFRGETEPLDPVAGHIPGARNRPTGLNVRPDGRFKPAEVLRAEFTRLLGDVPAERIVHSCGSGISACHNLLAMEFAGLGTTTLYPGSWSEWCADPSRPVATGD